MPYLFSGLCLQNKRPSNMDSLLLKNEHIGQNDVLLAVVCDGVGSLENGAFASGTTARMLNDWLGTLRDVDRIGLKMRDAILKINAYILSVAKEQHINTASTLSTLLLVNNAYYIAHVGDSRIYRYHPQERLVLLTNDDISTSGKLTACIGQTDSVVIQYGEGTAADHVFLLCTDGLYKRMDTDFLISKMTFSHKKALKESLATLARQVIDAGERDNISLALIKIES